ncbi:unnamed protein product [Didymodactylos carnosus]|uniref:Inhibitor of apoptosis 2 n=1 Tax=Didymodactylos carnosus TaxID=1234261 RepID=A0A8S2HYR6_9BILA|nr:unnamed protein product [Didymodactylos carnosus]CAF3694797.1 unnamed protein product [Didymodactylos carnosus]
MRSQFLSQPTVQKIDKNYKQMKEKYYQNYGQLIETMRRNLTTTKQTSLDFETKSIIVDKQLSDETKSIVKRKQRDDEGTQSSRKSYATENSSSRRFCESSATNEIRKHTFSHWQLKSPSKSQMIESGFFNCNVGDRVICIYCNLICQQWIVTDDPSEIHKMLSPDCCFVKSSLISTTRTSKVIINETRNVPLNTRIVLTQACNQQYMEISKRRESYATWPQEHPLPAIDDFVRAGFFYSGTKTIVTCFYCNGSLQNWGEKDNPMIEHARWFPLCSYAKQLCGDNLYHRIQQSKRVAHQARLNDSQEQNHTEFSVLLPNGNASIPNSSSVSQQHVLDENTLTRFVSARLDLPVSQRLLDEFKLSIIKRCYEDQLRLKLDDFSTDCDLYMACLILKRQIEVIDGKKENIVIPSKKLQEITEKNKQGT